MTTERKFDLIKILTLHCSFSSGKKNKSNQLTSEYEIENDRFFISLFY